MHLRNTVHKSKNYSIRLLTFRVRKWRCKQHLFIGPAPARTVLRVQGRAMVSTLGRRCCNGAFEDLLVHEGAAFCSSQPGSAVSRCAEY